MPPHGAGGLAFTIVPGGVITVRGRNAPEFTSLPGSRNDLTIVKAPVGAIAGPTLVGPAACGDVPVRSTVIASPATVTRALEVRFVDVGAVGQLADRAPHPRLRPIHQETDRFAHRHRAVAGGQRLDPLRRLSARADHGLEVALPL